jgi:hypothetical protein
MQVERITSADLEQEAERMGLGLRNSIWHWSNPNDPLPSEMLPGRPIDICDSHVLDHLKGCAYYAYQRLQSDGVSKYYYESMVQRYILNVALLAQLIERSEASSVSLRQWLGSAQVVIHQPRTFLSAPAQTFKFSLEEITRVRRAELKASIWKRFYESSGISPRDHSMETGVFGSCEVHLNPKVKRRGGLHFYM